MRPFPFSDVERKILEQHEEIRARIEGLRRGAERTDWARDALRVLLLRFAAHFDTHLAFEERELAPRIREIDAWGNVREAALRAEHREQRTRVEGVCAMAEAPVESDVACLFSAISGLADSLLEDMVAEERMLEEIARLDEYGDGEQMTG